MDQPIRVLIAEDLAADYEIAQREIRRTLPAAIFTRVETRQDFIHALDTFQPDLILSDYHLPHFDGMTALRLVQERAPLTPVIIWTGSQNEDTAVACMRAGASNYVIKAHLKRLGPAITHALEEKQLRLERAQMELALRASETRFRAMIENSSDGIALLDAAGYIRYVSDSVYRIAGYTPDDLVAEYAFDYVHPDDIPVMQQQLGTLVEQGHGIAHTECRVRYVDGEWHWVASTINNLISEPSIGAILFNFRDVTEPKRAQAAEHELRVLAQALSATAAALNSTLDLDTVLDQILENAGRVVPHDASTIMLLEGDFARVARSRGYSDASAEAIDSLELALAQTPNLREMAETGRPVLVADTRTYPNWRQTATREQQRAALGAPILYKGALLGFLSLDSFSPNAFTPQDAERLLAFADEAAIAIANARLLAESQGRANEFALLYELAHSLSEPQNLPQLLHAIVERATRLLGVTSGGLFLHQPQRAELELVVSQNFVLPEGMTVTMGKGLAGHVAATRTGMIVEDYSTWENRTSIPALRVYKSVLTVPMLSGGELIGVLGVGTLRASTRKFDERDLHLLSLLAGPAAGAVHTAQLLERMQKRLAELQTVNTISSVVRATPALDEMLRSLLHETVNLYAANSGSIWLYDSVRDELRMAAHLGWENAPATSKPGEQVPGHVFATGEPYVRRNIKYDRLIPESVRGLIPDGTNAAAVPIRAYNEIIGVMFLTTVAPRELGDDDVRLLNTLAEIAGAAIQRTRLVEQTQQQLERLSALRTVDRVISGSLDLKFVLNVVLEQAVAHLHVHASAVLLVNPLSSILEYSAGRGFHTREIERTHLRLGEGYAGHAVLERRIISVPSLNAAAPPFKRAALVVVERFETYYAAPLIAKGQVKGVLEVFHRAPLVLDKNWLAFLEALAGQTAIAIDNAELFEKLERTNMELVLAYDTTLEGWSRALDLRDKETEGHTERVTEMTVRLARAMGMDEATIVQMRRGALLHDIGKMGIPDSILLKQGPLTAEEWEIMRLHPVYAYELLSPIPYLNPALDIPYAHHEKWDGTGYPRGLKGEQIPLAARIFAVVDVWDALCSDRPYRSAWTREHTLDHLRSLAGTHFDPAVVQHFLQLAQEQSE